MSKETLRLSLPFALSILWLSGCQVISGMPSKQGQHWALDSVPARMDRHFVGYRSDTDGSFTDFQYRKKKDISRTLRRVFINSDPDNPFMADDASQTKRRPPHSLAPDPFYYLGAESVFSGLVIMGMSGAFIPVPLESLTATIFEPSGFQEFGTGFTEGADAEAESPPPVSRFRVKNR